MIMWRLFDEIVKCSWCYVVRAEIRLSKIWIVIVNCHWWWFGKLERVCCCCNCILLILILIYSATAPQSNAIMNGRAELVLLTLRDCVVADQNGQGSPASESAVLASLADGHSVIMSNIAHRHRNLRIIHSEWKSNGPKVSPSHFA